MNWLQRIRAWRIGELVDSVIRSHAMSGRSKLRRQRRPLLEQLETRLAPAITFDAATGLLTVLGDEAGPRDDVIGISIVRDESTDRNQFIAVTINGELHASKPGSKQFDPALTGATRTSVRSIEMQGLEGNDSLRLRNGFRHADGQVTLDGGPGADSLIGSSLAELLLGGPGNDFVVAGRGNDSVEGGTSNDTLLGGGGDDTLIGGAGTDSLDGGRGVNQLVEDGGTTDPTACGRGDDESADGTRGPAIAFDVETGRLSVDGDGRTNDVISVMITPGGFVEIEVNGVVRSSDPLSENHFEGLAGATSTTVTSFVARGFDGNDRIEVRDILSAVGGHTTLEGGCGDDTLIGSPASDRIDGGSGQDQLFGADGNDVLLGGDWADRLDGGAGEDTLVGAGGSDTLEGGAGDDYLAGGEELREGLAPFVANDEVDFLNGGEGDLDLAYDPRGEDVQDGVEFYLAFSHNHFERPGTDNAGHAAGDPSNHMAVASATAFVTTVTYSIDTADHGGGQMPAGMADRIREAAAAWTTPQVSFVEGVGGVHV